MLRNRARRENAPQSSAPEHKRLLPTVPFPRSFYKEAQPFPAADIKFRVLSSGILEVLNKFKRVHQSNLSQEHWQGFKEVRSLIANNSIRLSVSDKGGEFVVLPQSLDREITELHLSDTTIYQRATEKDFLTQCKRLNDTWISVGKSAGLDERFVSRLKLDKPNCPVFYSLVKTHKIALQDMHSMSAEVYKIRPIISCVGGPTDRISWFLNKIVSQLLAKIPSHLSNTEHFLQHLQEARFDRGCVVESFDVTSLYTNVQNDEALQALSELLDKHARDINTFGLSKARILILIRECLKCNIFKWSGKYFSQTRGLAMGQRLAPVLAICFMSRIEEPVLARLPVMYCRYIDDCCVVTSTQSEMDECFKILNEQSQYIKLTRETPREGWLPFLNTQINLSNGIMRVKWYRKGSSKNILIHAKSAHPAAVKRAVVRNMFKTAAKLCTGEEERYESRRIALKIANSNGYTTTQYQRRPSRAGTQSRTPRNSKLPLCLPFFSDKVSAAFQQCITRAQLDDDVILVNIPNDNIKKQLVRNRLYDKHCTTEQCVVCPHGNIGDCSKVGVVYQLECLSCHDLYIGETGRTLSVRIREHMATKRRGNLTSPLGRHKIEAHGGNDFDIKCKILAFEDDISARKALEAAWIFTRNPGMNSKNECLSITTDLLPFLSLCGLSTVDHIRSGRSVPTSRPLPRSRSSADTSAKGGTPGGSDLYHEYSHRTLP
ncbi:hypothetical protein Y032_0020g81 [Ancylostoma ceylanicum]|uniref:Reverse transcriptase domain-containing protein n=3 Tax=Ancylostoma ceylanicum TaxID=53326 RepID=A0A016V0Q1_9BILA|nr:hypothetical protein Y032_0020g81 [Ancylostoma ceylanicum]